MEGKGRLWNDLEPPWTNDELGIFEVFLLLFSRQGLSCCSGWPQAHYVVKAG